MAKPKPKRKHKPGAGGARPGAGAKARVFDWDEFEKLCGIQATLREMCGWFQCDEKTLMKACKRKYGMSFGEIFEQKRGRGKVALRRKQFEAALSGDTTMMIFLGKQYLDQADKKEVTQWVSPYALMSDEQLLEEKARLAGIANERVKQIEGKPELYQTLLKDVTPKTPQQEALPETTSTESKGDIRVIASGE